MPWFDNSVTPHLYRYLLSASSSIIGKAQKWNSSNVPSHEVPSSSTIAVCTLSFERDTTNHLDLMSQTILTPCCVPWFGSSTLNVVLRDDRLREPYRVGQSRVAGVPILSVHPVFIHSVSFDHGGATKGLESERLRSFQVQSSFLPRWMCNEAN